MSSERQPNVTSDSDNPEAQERLPLLASTKDLEFPELSPQTITRIIRRLQAMITRLIPIEVSVEELQSPTSSVLTSHVVENFKKGGGDFEEAVPYCLLECCVAFSKQAGADFANFEECSARSAASEALARRVLQTFDHTRQHLILSARYSHIEPDGDISLPISAIELASDTGSAFFISSAECQRVSFALWKGDLIQDWDSHGHTVFKINPQSGKSGFLPHWRPTQIIATPKWQNWLRILLWLLFLITYSITLKTPDRLFGPEDVIFYVQLIGYLEEEVVRFYKIGPNAALSFWAVVNYIIYAIGSVSFILRMLDINTANQEHALYYRRHSFYILSMAAPLIWMKLLTVFDVVYPFFGTMQILVARMIKESGIFFALLSLLAIGFAQNLFGLDNSDPTGSDSKVAVVRSLTEGLLGSPVFDIFVPGDGFIIWPYGLIAYYLWTAATTVILLNILISLFTSAYENIVSDASDQFLVFFTGKVISLTRAPDQYVYPAPFNLVEAFIIPLEPFLSRKTYAQINRTVLTILFWPIIGLVALYEGHYLQPKAKKEATLVEVEEDTFEEDPEADEADRDKGKIAKVPFEELTSSFPRLDSDPNEDILEQLKAMREQMDKLESLLQK